MIKPNDVVTLHYTVSTQDGTDLDSSRDGEPMQVMLGSKFLIEGLEASLIGKEKGDHYEITVSPEKAYGERHDALVQSVPFSMFEGVDVEPGMSFRATTEDGEQSVIIIEVNEEEDEVVVDGNHPLAGVTLSFDVEVLDVRAPTESEMKQGKACTTGCCH